MRQLADAAILGVHITYGARPCHSLVSRCLPLKIHIYTIAAVIEVFHTPYNITDTCRHYYHSYAITLIPQDFHATQVYAYYAATIHITPHWPHYAG